MTVVWVSRLFEDADPLANEGLTLSVQRTSGVFEFVVHGSEKQAAVELIGRCLSSCAVSTNCFSIFIASEFRHARVLRFSL